MTMLARGRLRISAIAVTLAVSVMLTGCGSHPAQPVAAAVVIGQRANSIAFNGSSALQDLVHEWVADGAQVAVVSAGGVPTVVRSLDLAITAANGLYQQEDTAAEQAAVLTDLLRTRAATPQADPLGAITLAARSVIDGIGEREVDIVDSGLQTTAPLAFQYGLLDESPATVVAFLRASDELPDLHGVDVIWYGLGQTEAPQDPLTAADYSRLRDIWSAILHASGAASVTIVSAPLPSATEVADLPPVTPVPIKPATSPDPGSALVVTLDPTSLDFVPNEAQYLDPARADAVLAVVAHEIRAGGFHHLVLTGTTALPPGITLSVARARQVAETLIADGIPASSIAIRGVGTDFPAFVPDDVGGVFDATAAALDRLVIVTATH
jgi:hypothetical protein